MHEELRLIDFTDQGKTLIASAENEDSLVRGLDLVAVFSGPLDAGQLASQVHDVLLENLESEELATFDIDRLMDYRARRPRVTFDGEKFTDYQMPQLQLHLVTDQQRQPFLLLSGAEPDFQWERFLDEVIQVIQHLDVQTVSTVDAMPMPVPHTRPMGITTHGNQGAEMTELSTWVPKAKMPSGVGQLLEIRLDEHHVPVTGYTLHVPHYLADARYPQAAVTALEYLSAGLALRLPADVLREQGLEVTAQLQEQTRKTPEIQAMVHALETQMDAYTEEHGPARSLLQPEDDSLLPDAEELGAAFEDFLSEQDEQRASDNSRILPSRSEQKDDED